jgi:hypothetical protein
MSQSKKQLNIIQNDSCAIKKVIPGTTCFATHAKFNVDCQRRTCKYWLSNDDSHNCVLIAAEQGPHTLQKIGQIYGLTRMRICQIEKNIYDKVRKIAG